MECIKSKRNASPAVLGIKVAVIITIILGVLIGVLYSLLTIGRKNNEHFEILCNMRSVAGDIPITHYKSSKTGLHVIFAKVEGPMVHGYFAVATETFDDDGLPHTLEHLVFLGSESYPYKGVYTLLANRCLSDGIDGWTDTDHTGYIIKTAGSDGFLILLPMFLDHLLYPTLTESGFITEVHHINGQGNDAGVVYSEMQARENTGNDLVYFRMESELYPQPSGYHYKTGGKMANLRENITLEKIRQFHRRMYRPENLYVIITGQVDPKDVFKTLEKFEEKIINKGEREPFIKPWQSPVPPLLKSEDIEIKYPSDLEDTCMVWVGWRGPSIVTNLTEAHSMSVLLKYLTDVSVSILPKVFVETEDPLASYLGKYLIPYSVSSATFTFVGVPNDRVHEVKPLLMQTFQQIVEGDIPFDIDVMHSTIHNLILTKESALETAPHYTLSNYIIRHTLYGRACEDLNKQINQIEWLEHLLTVPATYWINLIKYYFLESPFVFVKGFPSTSEGKRIQEEEKERIQERKKQLGQKGLEEWASKVAEADRINEIPAPESMLESVPVPSTSNINFHSLQVYTNIENAMSEPMVGPHPSVFDLKHVPFKMKLNNIKSNFVEIVAVMDTNALSAEARLYLPLLHDLLLESNILKDGEEMPFDEVVQSLNADTLKAKTINGLRMSSSAFKFGPFFHNVGIDFKVGMEKYEKAVKWMSDILFRVVFNAERVYVKASKLLNSIGDEKRDQSTMLRLMFNEVVYKKETNINRASILRQEKFLTTVIEELKVNPKKVLKDLNDIYRNITDVDNICIHLSTNFKKLAKFTNATAPWLNFIPKNIGSASLILNIISDWEVRNPFNVNHDMTGYIFGMGSVESSYLHQTTPSISSYTHKDLPALETTIAYLTQIEGPMWKKIRGKGLSYHCGIYLVPRDGTLNLKLTKASQLTEAYKETSKIINFYLNETESWDRLLFESAKSTLTYDIIKREADIQGVIQQSLYAYHRKVNPEYKRALIKAIDEVRLEDLSLMAEKYLKPLIDPKLSKTVIVCPSSKVAEMEIEMKRFGHSMKIIHSLENSTFADLEV